MKNAHMEMRFWSVASQNKDLYRNADGDWLLFIHQGNGDLFCDYGHMKIGEGDYVLIPRNCSFRINVDEAMKVLMIEATNDSFQLPEKGLVGRHAIFDPAMLDTPKINKPFEAQKNNEITQESLQSQKNHHITKISLESPKTSKITGNQ